VELCAACVGWLRGHGGIDDTNNNEEVSMKAILIAVDGETAPGEVDQLYVAVHIGPAERSAG
jgi:hypothetical protein